MQVQLGQLWELGLFIMISIPVAVQINQLSEGAGLNIKNPDVLSS